MSTFITTTQISSLIERTIKESEDFIILVSPYLQIHSRLKKIIEKKLISSEVPISIIYREKIPNEEKSWLDELKDKINIISTRNLHAKCFLNERDAILTSMNLYNYSMVNNIEFGVHFEKLNDNKNYSEIISEVINLGLTNVNFSKRNVRTKQVDLIQLLRDSGATKFDFDTDINGKETFCLFKGDANIISIKIGSEIILIQNGENRIREIVNNYQIYYIELFTISYYQFGLKR